MSRLLSSATLLVAGAVTLGSMMWAQVQGSESTRMALSQQGTTGTDFDLEQLAAMDIKVTSASRRVEQLSQAPAAIFVLTEEGLRRGGYTNLPDALRQVPGLYVAQITPHTWQISARGFGDIDNNKMLVLVDGRSVYTPLYGGVNWDVLDVPLENIERVEVIRGPGGTLWGANAVNGVINIVTKEASKTPGVMVSTSADVNQGYTATVRYGDRIGDKIAYRVHARSTYGEPLGSASGGTLPDQFNLSQAGVRLDWTASPRDVVTLEGGTYDGRFREQLWVSPGVASTNLVKGSYAQLQWKRTFSERSQLDSMVYCDWFTRGGITGEMRNTCDFEFQHRYALKPRHSVVWGGAFLTTGDNATASMAGFLNPRRRDHVGSGFAQYEIQLVPNRLQLLAGVKLEHNDVSGFEYQPQARAVWTPNRMHTLWGAVSRAVRVPSRSESELNVVLPAGVSNGLPLFLYLRGNLQLESERLRAYEIGYRYEPVKQFSADLAIYYNQYSNLVVDGTAVPQILPNMIIFNMPLVNGGRAQTHGLEVSARWIPSRRWTILAGVTELRGTTAAVTTTPKHMFSAQSRLNLPHRIEFDTSLYHYNALPPQNNIANPFLPMQGVATSNRVDVGMTWHATPQWTFGVWGRNLQSEGHIESLDSALSGSAGEVPRAIVFKVLWQWQPERAAKASP